MELEITIREKLEKVLAKIRELKKTVLLFAVVQREDTDTWDLVIGGKDIEKKDNFDLIAKIIREILDESEIVKVPRLVLLNPEHPFIVSINREFAVEGGTIKIENTRINNIFLKNAYLVYSSNSTHHIKREKCDEEEKNVKVEDTRTSSTAQINAKY